MPINSPSPDFRQYYTVDSVRFDASSDSYEKKGTVNSVFVDLVLKPVQMVSSEIGRSMWML